MLASRAVYLACSTLLALGSGCAGFRGKDALPNVDPETLRSAPATPTRVYTRWSFAPDGPSENSAQVVALGIEQKERFDRALLGTDCCRIVDAQRDADVVVEGTVHGHDYTAARLAVSVSGATLSVIPAWVNQRVHLSAKAFTGSRAYAYDVRDRFLGVFWLPMIAVAPFANPIRMEKEMQDNAVVTLVKRIKDDGLLDAGATNAAATAR